MVAYVGGKQATLLKTMDGGVTWMSLYPSLRNLNVVGVTDHIMYHAISAISSSVVYVSVFGRNVIFKVHYD